MTAYRDFVLDFPDRCQKLKGLVEKEAEKEDKDVTLLIAIASAGFVIPYERIREHKERKEEKKHHPSDDYHKFEKLSKAVKALEEEDFLKNSDLCPDSPTGWRTGKVKLDEIRKMPDEWDDKGKPVSQEIKVEFILDTLRNALCHGSIYCTKEDPITEIVFTSEERKNNSPTDYHNWLLLPPDEFSKFLDKWFKFIEKNCPTNQASDANSLNEEA